MSRPSTGLANLSAHERSECYHKIRLGARRISVPKEKFYGSWRFIFVKCHHELGLRTLLVGVLLVLPRLRSVPQSSKLGLNLGNFLFLPSGGDWRCSRSLKSVPPLLYCQNTVS